ncbi:MAG TPA: PIN/TRAM domain-containing protein [Planctomycetes bacterium]|nr:PIN/TRAM domain-containing protein [Planctomycetota bacterium]
MAERIALHTVRGFFILVCAGIGLYCADQFGAEQEELQWLLGACAVAVVVVVVEIFTSRGEASTLSAVVFGLLLGLVLSSLFQQVNGLILASVGVDVKEDERPLRFMNIVTTALCCYFGVTLLLHTHGRYKILIPFVEFRREVKDRLPALLDTSALIDGRIEQLVAAGIVNCRLLVPRAVLEELHALSDSSDKLKRERGRRGLELLERLRRERQAEIVPSEHRPGEVDAVLLGLTADLGGWIVTTDATLAARGRVQGVQVVNLNEVADGMRLQAAPGERVEVNVLREGEGPQQGVGFLPDGTMVVVENGKASIGRKVEVEITGTIRTSAGRIVFARPAEEKK